MKDASLWLSLRLHGTAAITKREFVLLWSPFSESGDKAFELFVHSDQQPSQFGRQFPRQHYLA